MPFWAALCAAIALVCTACSTTSGHAASLTRATGSSRPAASSGPSSSSRPAASSGPAASPPAARLHPRRGQLTRGGMWWGVDSTGPITEAALANVGGWYRGSPRPLVWGRYLTGSYALRPGELAFARAHGILVYLIVPDLDCSVCAGGGDVCGSDRTADQAREDARRAVRAAIRGGVPARATLFKDIEQIGACSGELTAEYLLAWYRYVRTTRYRVGFYGNTFRQFWDFPVAYCAALRADRRFGRDVVLAQNEPEPAIGAPRGTIGPRTAPPFAPYVPSCAPRGATRIWQYGESLTSENYTDVDEILPGTHGLLAPDGSTT